MVADRPRDQAARTRAIDPARSYIVEAPAGSGKTELLTRRFLALLSIVEAPEEIVAITFTRKAASEMRARVVAALAKGEGVDPPADPHELEAWQLARAALAADRKHGWQLTEHPARLRIQTIDALNQSLAHRLPVLSGMGAALRITDDAEALYAEAVRRVIRSIADTGPEARAIESLVLHLDNDLDTLGRLLIDLLSRREHWLEHGVLVLTGDALRRALQESLERAIHESLSILLAMFPDACHATLVDLAAASANELRDAGMDSAIVACADLEALPGTTIRDLPAWQGIAALLLTEQGAWRSRISKSIGVPPEAKARKEALRELLACAADDDALAARLHATRSLPQVEYSEREWRLLEALLLVLRVALAELEIVFQEQGQADHTAMAIAARRALGSIDEPSDLALRYDYRLQHILVDEFQDTSRGQVELLRLLTAGWTGDDGRTLFLVGDPMQSIYGFREAEVGLFLDVKRRGLGQVRLEPIRLEVNFRSNEPLIAWVNETFPLILPHRDDFAAGAVAFAPAAARPGASPAGRVQVHAIAEAAAQARSTEASNVVAICSEAIARRHDARIAVLVASRNHLPDILAALRRAGLKTRAVEIDPLARRTAVRDLIALTRALVHPADRTAWLSILRAPWSGLDLAALHVLAGDGTETQSLRDLMADDERAAQLTPDSRTRLARVRAVLEDALALRGRLGLREWVERTWNSLGGPATLATAADLADAETYLSRLELVDRGGDLEDVAALDAQIAGLYGSSGTDALEDAIDVMTIHKAKGLEFDVVIVPGLERVPRRAEVPLLRWAEYVTTDGRGELLLAPMAPRGDADADPIHAWLGRTAQARLDHERARLLYVAATRAVESLHLIANVEPQARDGTVVPGRPNRGSLLALLWPAVAPRFALQAHSATDASSANPPSSLRRLPNDWQLPRADPPLARTARLDVIEQEPLRPEFDWVSETGRHVGTVVHREIERRMRLGGAVPEAQVRARYALELAELGVPPRFRAEAIARAVAATVALTEDERARWILAGDDVHERVASELALSGLVGDELVNGVIDRTFIDASGTRWIIDFKTSAHEGGDREMFLASEAQRYRPQLARYAALMRALEPDHGVRTALYFPLLRAWIEVEV
jgi:ATP-dependent exoDNAse (exonuclease V) beta subunit